MIKYFKKYYTLIAVVLFFIAYLFFFPFNWMITDSNAYSSHAIAIASGSKIPVTFDFLLEEYKSTISAFYIPGNALFQSLFVYFLGKKYIFLTGIICALISGFFISKTLANYKLPAESMILFFVSIPLLFFTRSLMSCMPSLLVVSVFLFFYSLTKKSKFNFLLLGFLIGISTIFRETNLIILGLLAIDYCFRNRSAIPFVVLGGLVGLALRIYSTLYFFGNPWMLNASDGFSFSAFFEHLPCYLFICFILIPGGFLFLLFTKNRFSKTFFMVAVIFLLFYASYNYSAVDYSGFLKGSLINSRFILPLLPLFIVGFGFFLKEKPRFLKYSNFFSFASLLAILGSQFMFHRLLNNHENTARIISDKYQNKFIIYDQSGYTNIIRYINPVTGNWLHIADLNGLNDEKLLNKMYSIPEDIFIVTSFGNGNSEKISRSDKIQNIISNIPKSTVDSLIIDTENYILIQKVTK